MMKKTYIKPEFESIVLDIEILQNVTGSLEVDGHSEGGSGGDGPGTGAEGDEGDVNKSSLWDEEEDYL